MFTVRCYLSDVRQSLIVDAEDKAKCEDEGGTIAARFHTG